MTIGQLYAEISQELEQAGVESAAFEASVLIEELLGLTPGGFLLGKGDAVTDERADGIRAAAKRRSGGEPLQYIIGSWEFYGRRMIVGENVFIPRPETEQLIERLSELPLPDNPKIADLCSGSGCIAIAAAAQFPKAQVFSVELSDKALGYIRRNVELNHTQNVTVVQRDVLRPPDFSEGSPDRIFDGLDVILSNPPYVPTWQIDGLQREVQREPHMALDGGGDGLDFYRAITEGWKKALKPGGMLMYEIGDGQARDVSEIMERAGYRNIKVYKDYAGTDRIVAAEF